VALEAWRLELAAWRLELVAYSRWPGPRRREIFLLAFYFLVAA